MASALQTIAKELTEEWEFVLYVGLTTYVSLVYARDRRTEKRALRASLNHLEQLIDERLTRLEQEIRRNHKSDQG